jgi:hypothetical protein
MEKHQVKAAGPAAAALALALAATGASATAARKQCTWSACSNDARWVRSMLRHAGLRKLGSTGSAVTARVQVAGGSKLYYIWATPGTRLSTVYTPTYTAAGTGVFGDGTRIVWRSQGAHVWIEPALPRTTVTRIVLASRTTPRH